MPSWPISRGLFLGLKQKKSRTEINAAFHLMKLNIIPEQHLS
jgi:hypothetical protein